MVREESTSEKRLVAYVVAGPGDDVSAAALRTELGRRLPDYMVPSAVVVLACVTFWVSCAELSRKFVVPP